VIITITITITTITTTFKERAPADAAGQGLTTGTVRERGPNMYMIKI
jgi:hypothetical protein